MCLLMRISATDCHGERGYISVFISSFLDLMSAVVRVTLLMFYEIYELKVREAIQVYIFVINCRGGRCYIYFFVCSLKYDMGYSNNSV